MLTGARNVAHPRALVRVLLVVLPALFVLLSAERAEAYTWMIKHSYGGCPVCHADPSGGEVLTPYGRAQSDILLRMQYGEPKEEGEPSKSSQFLWFLELPPSVMLGGSARLASTLREGEFRAFPMQLDLYGQLRFGNFFAGGSIGLSRVEVGSPHARAAQVTKAQGKEYNALSRTHYLGMDFAQGKYTVRAGRLNLPFGIRVPEHTLWAREATRTDRESDQQHGVALAFNGEEVRGEAMAILGNYQINPDAYRERGYSFFVEVMAGEQTALGVSSLYTLAERDRITNESNIARGAHGGMFRATLFEPLVLLGEANLLTDSTRKLGYTGFLQGDYEIVQGLHGMLTFEVLDQGYPRAAAALGPSAPARTPGEGKLGFGTWISAGWFFLPHLDMRVDAVIRSNDFTLLSQLHAFL